MNDTAQSLTHKDSDPPIDRILRAKDFFPIRGRFNVRDQTYAVNFDYIRRTGKIPLHPTIRSGDARDLYIEKIEDTLGCEIQNIINQAYDEVMGYPEMQRRLTQMPSWTKEERAKFDRDIVNVSHKRLQSIPALKNYRTSPKDDVRRSTRLNDLSSEIECNSQMLEYDCEAMSILTGYVTQSVERMIFERNPQYIDKSSWKRPMNFFLVAGGAQFLELEPSSGHTYVITPTGDAIESTAGTPESNLKECYIFSKNNYSIEKLHKGMAFMGEEGRYSMVYGNYPVNQHDLSDYTIARKYENLKNSSDFDTLKNKLSGYMIDYNKQHDIFVTISEEIDKNSDHVMRLYAKVDKGTPYERYIPLAHPNYEWQDYSLVSDTDPYEKQTFFYSHPENKNNFQIRFTKSGVIQIYVQETKPSISGPYEQTGWKQIVRNNLPPIDVPLQNNRHDFKDNQEKMCFAEPQRHNTPDPTSTNAPTSNC